MNKRHIAWDVILNNKIITTVFYDATCNANYVRETLINHDGYPNNIQVIRKNPESSNNHNDVWYYCLEHDDEIQSSSGPFFLWLWPRQKSVNDDWTEEDYKFMREIEKEVGIFEECECTFTLSSDSEKNLDWDNATPDIKNNILSRWSEVIEKLKKIGFIHSKLDTGCYCNRLNTKKKNPNLSSDHADGCLCTICTGVIHIENNQLKYTANPRSEIYHPKHLKKNDYIEVYPVMYRCKKCGDKDNLYVTSCTVAGEMHLNDEGFIIEGDTEDEVVLCKKCGHVHKGMPWEESNPRTEIYHPKPRKNDYIEVYDIEYDIDEDETANDVSLPSVLRFTAPEDFNAEDFDVDELPDLISDKIGFCVLNFKYRWINKRNPSKEQRTRKIARIIKDINVPIHINEFYSIIFRDNNKAFVESENRVEVKEKGRFVWEITFPKNKKIKPGIYRLDIDYPFVTPEGMESIMGFQVEGDLFQGTTSITINDSKSSETSPLSSFIEVSEGEDLTHLVDKICNAYREAYKVADKYGFWYGHGIEDLVIERINIFDDNSIEMLIGS